MDAWVWTTFNDYQWDLNWSNPELFQHMALALLHLANHGVEVFRLDSAAYLWKRAGTNCCNLPEAHAVLQALRSEEHTSELQSLMRISYAVFCLKKKKKK